MCCLCQYLSCFLLHAYSEVRWSRAKSSDCLCFAQCCIKTSFSSFVWDVRCDCWRSGVLFMCIYSVNSIGRTRPKATIKYYFVVLYCAESYTDCDFRVYDVVTVIYNRVLSPPTLQSLMEFQNLLHVITTMQECMLDA